MSEKNMNLSTIDKVHLKCDIIDGSIIHSVRQPIM